MSRVPQARYVQAKLSVHDRSLKVATVIESLEMEMELLCLTGVEDQLQADVRPTLEILRNAGIKVSACTHKHAQTMRFHCGRSYVSQCAKNRIVHQNVLTCNALGGCKLKLTWKRCVLSFHAWFGIQTWLKYTILLHFYSLVTCRISLYASKKGCLLTCYHKRLGTSMPNLMKTVLYPGLDVDRGQIRDCNLHSQERPSSDPQSGHPRVQERKSSADYLPQPSFLNRSLL